MNTCYVTTTIPYVNARPHVGFALELVQADTIARWHRLNGRTTRFQTGTDENASKNVQTARELGTTTQELCTANSAAYERLLPALDISTDRFVRTSSEEHHRSATRFWNACRPEDIELRNYEGLYCTGCEDFYLEKDLTHGTCPIHGTEPQPVSERNYFFRLSSYQDRLESLIATDEIRVRPASRKNEVLAFIRSRLRDFSISRDSQRTGGWGVPVPGDPSQILYVWFDALINYLTGLGYAEGGAHLETFWLGNVRKLHVLGKDVAKFHAVYWPAMLLSAGLPVPDEILVHGFLTAEGRKIGKSLGNAVDPFPLVEEFGIDTVRYYLLRGVPASEDGDVSRSRLKELYTADLANGLGNLVLRLEALLERANLSLAQSCPAPSREVGDAVEAFEFGRALGLVWDRIRTLNRQIETVKPWTLKGPGDEVRLKGHLVRWAADILAIGVNLKPFLPSTAAKILASLGRTRVTRGPALFPRLN